MTLTLVLTESVAEEIERATREPLETAGVLLAGLIESPQGDARLLAQRIFWVADSSYIVREADRLTIDSLGYVKALGEAEREGAVAIWFHTHPGESGRPLPSQLDAIVDEALADVFRLRANTPYYGALIASPRPEGFAFSGWLEFESHRPVKIERIWRVGSTWRLQRSFDAILPSIAPIFDRSVRAFGPAIQGTLGDLRIGIVGCGGTGSSLAEQLVRLGVRHLTLIDADVLSASNVTRVYGSTPKDVGRPKVDVLRDHLIGIAPDLACEPAQGMVTLQPMAKRLLRCDLIFGCTDDNAGRLVLSRIATYAITPVIDLGVMLSATAEGGLIGIDGRVTVLSPGIACLVCRQRIDMARAAAELMTPDERRRLADEGYAPSLEGVEPAVIAFTTSTAAAAVNELLERLIGYGPEPRPSEILLRWHDREMSTNAALPNAGHYCDPSSGKLGRAYRQPFLEQAWPE